MARKMKDSGIEWIGEIPEGWRTINPKALFTQRKDKAQKGERQLTSSQQYGILYQDDYMELTGSKVVTVEKDFDILKHVEAGDFVISMRSFQGGLEYSTKSGAISSAYVMLVPNLELVYPRFYRWLLKSSVYIDALQRTTSMVRDGQAMRYSNFAQVRLFTLPLDEQKSRADFLDLECSSIDKILFKTRSSIEEYKKLKQAVITQAVTKGVRGEREMKPTDFTRWSEIPFDWNLKRVKSCIASISSGLSAVTDDANSEESGKFVLRTSAVSSGFFVPTEVKPVLKSAVNRLICPVEPDTLIVSRMNTASMVGACAYVANNHPNTFLPDKLWKIKFLPSYHTKYMWYALNSVPAKSWFSELATGASSSMQNISINDFTSNYLPIPAFSEQEEIADYLDAKCAEIDKLIAKKEQLVKELESYKKSLIYEVVTGKREV